MDENTLIPITCIEVGRNELDTYCTDEPLPFKNIGIASLLLCDAGWMELVVNGTTLRVEPRSLLLVSPSLGMHLSRYSEDFHGYFVNSESGVMSTIIRSVIDMNSQLYFRDHPLQTITPEQHEELKLLIRELKRRIDDERSSTLKGARRTIAREFIMLVMRALTYETLDILLVNTALEPKKYDRNDALTYQFIVELFNNFHEHRDVAFYATKLCVSPSHLSTVVKQKTGKPALQWIIDLVVNEAKQDLLYSCKSVKEIAMGLGFTTQSFFGKYFKKYVGVSPKAFRERARG